MFVADAYAQTTPSATPAEPATPAPETAAPAAEDAHDAASHGDASHAGTEVAGEHGGGVFPPFDTSTYPSQLLWLAITFGLFYLFLKKVVLPRIGGILEVRGDRIAQDLEQAARMKDEADAAIAAYEQELARAKANAGEIGQQARDKAKAEAEAERKTAQAGLDRQLAEATARIDGIKSAAMAEVGAIASDTAEAIIESLVGAKASRTEIDAAVRRAGA